MTLAKRRNLKLATKFYGPYQVNDKIGYVAYKLALPLTTTIHLIFHVSRIKKKWGENIMQ